MCWTHFVLLLDMIAFLVFNSRGAERHDSGRCLGSAKADLQFVN